MLRELRIKNFAIIDEVVMELKAGLNILTGETGAGKSIILNALGLIAGERGAADIIRTVKMRQPSKLCSIICLRELKICSPAPASK